MRLRAATAPPGVPGCDREPSESAALADRDGALRASRAAGARAHAHSSASTTSVATATSRAGVAGSMPPCATRPGSAHAAPSGVSASAETASASCDGTRAAPLERREEDADRHDDDEHREHEEPRQLARAALAQEQRGQRHADAGEQHARRDAEQRRPTAAAGHGTPCSRPDDRRAHRRRAIRANDRDADESPRPPAPRRACRWAGRGRRTGADRADRSAPAISGASANPRVTAEPPSTMTASTTSVGGIPQRQQRPARRRSSRRRAGRGRARSRVTCAASPRRAPRRRAILSRRTCAATRGPPRR